MTPEFVMRSRWEDRVKVLGFVLVATCIPVTADEGATGHERTAVRLPRVAIGETYSTWRLGEAPLQVRNPGDDTLMLYVAVVIPARHELSDGALPVPDRSWIAVEQSTFILPPQSTARTDVRLTLPYDPELAGHTYQVDLRSTMRARGVTFPGPRHRLLFAVAMDYRDDTELDLACAHSRP
jgi:hypothetical protein